MSSHGRTIDETGRDVPVTKHRDNARTAALAVINRLDHESPTELEIWGCGPCPEYPDGLIGLAEIERMKRPNMQQETISDVNLIMLPFGRGKLIGND